MSKHMYFVLTCTVLFASMLRHCDLSEYDGFPLQNILIVAIRDGLLFGLRAVMLRPVAVVVGAFNLGEDRGFVEQRQVSLKVEVRVQVLIGPVSEALVVFRPHRPSSAAVPQAVFLRCGLRHSSAARRTCRSWEKKLIKMWAKKIYTTDLPQHEFILSDTCSRSVSPHHVL